MPSKNYISGADGYWYDFSTGDAYLQIDVPSKTAATYVASKDMLPEPTAYAVYSADDNS